MNPDEHISSFEVEGIKSQIEDLNSKILKINQRQK